MTLKLGPDAAPSSGADAQAEAEIRAEAARQERIAREAEELEALRAFKVKVEAGGASLFDGATQEQRSVPTPGLDGLDPWLPKPDHELAGEMAENRRAAQAELAAPVVTTVAAEPNLKARVRLEKGSRVLLPWTTQQNSFKDVLEEGVDFGQLWMDSGFVCMAEPNGGARSVSVHGSHIRQIDYA